MLSRRDLQDNLTKRFVGSSELRGLKIKTRSKRAKEMACEALGLPVPKVFPRTKPRFLSENFDLSVQAANNFQVWNQELDAARRYAFVILDEDDLVRAVRVLTGVEVEKLRTSVMLTGKFQARFADYDKAQGQPIVHAADTDAFRSYRSRIARAGIPTRSGPDDLPGPELLSVEDLAARLRPLIGVQLSDPGATQERLRGQQLHDAVCRALGYPERLDSGQHPDIPNQLVEVKLQTSPTIDLGLADPSSTAALPDPFPAALRYCDVRYAVFGAVGTSPDALRITSIHVVPGESFFGVFERFGGKGKNVKLQIHLPLSWFA